MDQWRKEWLVAMVMMVVVTVAADWKWALVVTGLWTVMQATLRGHVVGYESRGHPVSYDRLGFWGREVRRTVRPGWAAITWQCPSCHGKSRVPHPRSLPEGRAIGKITCPHCGATHPHRGDT